MAAQTPVFPIPLIRIGESNNLNQVITDVNAAVTPLVYVGQEHYNAKAMGANGGGNADDTAALQFAINTALAGNKPLFVPPGSYRTTAPLVIGDGSSSLYYGFKMYGSNRYQTRIKLTPTSDTSPVQQQAVVIWNKNAWRDAYFGDIALRCAFESTNLSWTDGAQYGLLIASTELSNCNFNNINIQDATTAIGMLTGTGSNGEFCRFSNFQAINVLNFFYTDAGQALDHSFSHGFILFRAGGTVFKADCSVVGGGMHLFNVSATVQTPRPTVSNSVLFDVRQNSNSPISVVGGRFEHITGIINLNSGNQNGIVYTPFSFVGSTFTTDWRTGDITNTIASVINENGTGIAPNRLSFQGCRFDSVNAADSSQRFDTILPAGSRTMLTFDQCGWDGYGAVPSFAGGTYGATLAYVTRQCHQDGTLIT